MELHPFDRKLAMAQSHDRAVLGLGGDLENFGKRFPLDNERVIARRLERIGNSGEHTSADVANRGRLTVHDARRSDDLAAEDMADALMAEANAEDRNAAGEVSDRLVADA